MVIESRLRNCVIYVFLVSTKGESALPLVGEFDFVSYWIMILGYFQSKVKSSSGKFFSIFISFFCSEFENLCIN